MRPTEQGFVGRRYKHLVENDNDARALRAFSLELPGSRAQPSWALTIEGENIIFVRYCKSRFICLG